MKILTWNINGVRTVPQYHPWNDCKSHREILDKLDADIICFQEMKITRQNLPSTVAFPPSYTSFFSFPHKKSGYSGVAVYTRDNIVPCKAEDTLTGVTAQVIQPEDRISQSLLSYPAHSLSDALPGDIDFKSLDSEGRSLVLDFGLFVLFNLYCPNDGAETDERMKYKMDYHQVLKERVRTLIENEHREVIVVGDMNAVASVRDHCEGCLIVKQIRDEQTEAQELFLDQMPARRWLNEWLVERGGCMVDVCRYFWPDREAMYTCWNTKISARASNYGTRIDYILVTSGLLPLVRSADIQPQIKGSDHCPVVIEFIDEIPGTVELPAACRSVLRSTSVPLRDLMSLKTPETAPCLAAGHWDEYSGRQTLLDGFFGGKGKGRAPSFKRPAVSKSSSAVSGAPPADATTSIIGASNPVQSSVVGSETAAPDFEPATKKRKLTLSVSKSSPSLGPSSGCSFKKKVAGKGKEKVSSDQTNLAVFFTSSSTRQASTQSRCSSRAKSAATAQDITDASSLDADYQLALRLSQEEEISLSTSSRSQSSSLSSQKSAWKDLLTPVLPPRCLVHGEPAKEFIVNKKGENKGRAFYYLSSFICFSLLTPNRPVGPGYDKGRSERRREDVDPQWKCDFFKWKSDVKREARMAASPKIPKS
ncbi:DNase I-like protein [Fistulina hepatica ATCC 64428]|nr:DNase I-like protein [Fistulina hepatica ATCC 64428]